MESYMLTRHFNLVEKLELHVTHIIQRPSPSTRPPFWLHNYQDHINLCGEQLERFIEAMTHLKKQVGPLRVRKLTVVDYCLCAWRTPYK